MDLIQVIKKLKRIVDSWLKMDDVIYYMMGLCDPIDQVSLGHTNKQNYNHLKRYNNNIDVVNECITKKYNSLLLYHLKLIGKVSTKNIRLAIKNNQMNVLHLLEQHDLICYNNNDYLIDAIQSDHVKMVRYIHKKLLKNSCVSINEKYIFQQDNDDIYAYFYKKFDLNHLCALVDYNCIHILDNVKVQNRKFLLQLIAKRANETNNHYMIQYSARQ